MHKVATASLNWALEHLRLYSDTDKFPRPFEVDVIERYWNSSLRLELEKIDLEQHRWKGERKMLVPKDSVSFRNAAQLDPADALLFAALIHELGAKIEAIRVPVVDKRVFSYRFAPQPDGSLYSPDMWEQFWRTSIARAQKCKSVVVLDITDYYNQVSHHSIETQLQKCGLSPGDIRVLLNLLKSCSASVSKGIPIGPHPTHLLAESALVPLDEFLLLRGFDFCRYVDDIHIFCPDREHAQVALFAAAQALDQYHKLTLNRSKTHVFTAKQFVLYATNKAHDQPINSEEKSLLKVVKKYSTGPYTTIPVSRLRAVDLAKLSQVAVEEILNAYLDSDDVDFVRLRFFLRRLSQVGVPSGVELVVHRISELQPAFAEVAGYLSSATNQYTGSWSSLGEEILALLDSPIARESEYIQLVLLGLFGRIAGLNHIDKLLQRYGSSNASAQREIVLAAANAGADSWLRTLKADFSRWDPWLRRAFVYAARVFPKDEREFWLKAIKRDCATPLEFAILSDSAR